MKWLTIIVLTFNEEQNIKRSLDNIFSLNLIEEAEVLVADGSSTDRTREMIYKNVPVVISEPNRSIQMTRAVDIAKGMVLWFLHADMELPVEAITNIKKVIKQGYHGGGFANVFDKYNDRIKRLGTILNFRFFNREEQSDRGIFYGDNGIFIMKDKLMEIGGIPQQDIMEDYEMSIRLQEGGAKMIKITTPSIVVSSRRHIKEGFVKVRIKWILIRKLYQWGVKPSFLKKLYKDN